MRAWASDISSWNLASSPYWNYQRFLDSYKRLETFRSLFPLDPDQSYRGLNGPIATTSLSFKDSLSAVFIKAAQAVGLSYSSDFNNPFLPPYDSVGYYQFAIDNGIRSGVMRSLLSKSLLSPKAMSGLTVVTHAMVTRVLLSKIELNNDGEQFQAYGVEYIQDGTLKSAILGTGPLTTMVNNVNKKDFQSIRTVILSAGAVMTPTILMSSGIGDPDILESNGLSSKIVNAAVGKNLQTHPTIDFIAELSESIVGDIPTIFSFAKEWISYVDTSQTNRPTSLFATPGFSAGGFLVSPYSDNDLPDIQLTFFPDVSLFGGNSTYIHCFLFIL